MPLVTEATVEGKKRTLVRTIAAPRTIDFKSTNYSRRFGFTHRDTLLSTQAAKMRQENSRVGRHLLLSK